MLVSWSYGLIVRTVQSCYLQVAIESSDSSPSTISYYAQMFNSCSYDCTAFIDFLYTQGLFQKAEALYSIGNFEYALVFYHRGNKIRPELHQFTLGIQKAQEAIDNSIGSKIIHLSLF